jgi:multisubunit Na+/H+ antiporter MnhB subunit
VGLLVGFYLVWAGAKQPGGAFQGGTVLAAVGLLAAMSGLLRPPPVTSATLRLTLIVGPAVFLSVGLWGLTAGGFLTLPEAVAKALIVGVELALTLSIAVTLGLLILGPPEVEAKE